MMFATRFVPHGFGILSTAVIALRLLSSSASVSASSVNADPDKAQTVYEFNAMDIKGHNIDLEKYRGHVLIIVNVASQCGYTAQHYKELNELHTELADTKGLRILAFPCDQFAGQEPGTNEEIQCFAFERKVKFDMFEKIDVNGDGAHPLFKFLKKQQAGTLFDFIKWNFTKFVIDKNGKPVARFGPNTSPLEMKPELEKYF